MNLGEIRTLLIERSGRADLVVTVVGNADNGANFFIQSGQRTLDRLVGIDKSWARSFKEMAIGDYYVTFKGCRAVKGVWFSNSDGRVKVDKVSLEEMRELYGDAPNEITNSKPLNYCITPLRTYPDEGVTIDYFVGNQLEGEENSEYEYSGILVLPPTDEVSLIEVLGLFYSPPLENDNDESSWSVNHPEVLLMAALYHIEIAYRNTEGANDWMRAIQFELDGIDKDQVESDIAGVSQIEG